MFAAESIASPPTRQALMIECRNDLLVQRAWRKAAIEQLVATLTEERLL